MIFGVFRGAVASDAVLQSENVGGCVAYDCGDAADAAHAGAVDPDNGFESEDV